MAPETSTADEGFEEVTLADIVRVLWKRRLVLIVLFLVIVAAGVAITAFTTPQYESKATVVPLEHPDIIKNWLDSRHSGEVVVTNMGSRIQSSLFPDRWNDATQSWDGASPTLEEFGRALTSHVTVGMATSRVGSTTDRLLTLTVEYPDPLLARDICREYLVTLNNLRPHLENITRQEAFDKYYDGSNEQEAQRRAEVAADQKEYWIVLDDASLPVDPSSPNWVLNVALSVVVGLLVGVFAVFFTEWLGRYRAETKAVRVPSSPREGGGASPPVASDQPASPWSEGSNLPGGGARRRR